MRLWLLSLSQTYQLYQMIMRETVEPLLRCGVTEACFWRCAMCADLPGSYSQHTCSIQLSAVGILVPSPHSAVGWCWGIKKLIWLLAVKCRSCLWTANCDGGGTLITTQQSAYAWDVFRESPSGGWGRKLVKGQNLGTHLLPRTETLAGFLPVGVRSLGATNSHYWVITAVGKSFLILAQYLSTKSAYQLL